MPVLLKQAARPEPEVCDAAILAIRTLAVPTDVPAMIRVLLTAKLGARRDEMEKAVVAISGQIADVDHRADAVMEAYAAAGTANRVALLPLLGRLRDARTLAAIRDAMKSGQLETREAAIRGLCNWPDASVRWNFLIWPGTRASRTPFGPCEPMSASSLCLAACATSKRWPS